MTYRARQTKQPLKMNFWRPAKNEFRADKLALLEAILASGKSNQDFKRSLGAGYDCISELLNGKAVGYWSAYFLEYALSPDDGAKKPHFANWP